MIETKRRPFTVAVLFGLRFRCFGTCKKLPSISRNPKQFKKDICDDQESPEKYRHPEYRREIDSILRIGATVDWDRKKTNFVPSPILANILRWKGQRTIQFFLADSKLL